MSRLSRLSLVSTLRALGVGVAGGGVAVEAATGTAGGAGATSVALVVRRPPPTTLLTIRVVGVPAYSDGAGIASVETMPS